MSTVEAKGSTGLCPAFLWSIKRNRVTFYFNFIEPLMCYIASIDDFFMDISEHAFVLSQEIYLTDNLHCCTYEKCLTFWLTSFSFSNLIL